MMRKRSSTWQIRLWLPIEVHGFTSRINSKGYHSLVPGLISIFFREGLGPFQQMTGLDGNRQIYFPQGILDRLPKSF